MLALVKTSLEMLINLKAITIVNIKCCISILRMRGAKKSDWRAEFVCFSGVCSYCSVPCGADSLLSGKSHAIAVALILKHSHSFVVNVLLF